VAHRRRVGVHTIVLPSPLIAQWLFPADGGYTLATERSSEPMNSLKLSIFILLGSTAVAWAKPSTEADLAIKADLAQAQLALAQHNISAAVDTLDDTMKYLPNADEPTLQALIDFQDRVRETLAGTSTKPNVSSPPALPGSAPFPPDQTAAPHQSRSGSIAEQQPGPPLGPVASPPGPELSANATPSPTPGEAREHSSEPRITLPWTRPRAQQPPGLAVAAKPLLARAAAAPSPEPVPDVQTAPKPAVRTEASLKLLGYYAQDEHGKWVWLPAGSGNAPSR
jgi:hypothetical protein